MNPSTFLQFLKKKLYPLEQIIFYLLILFLPTQLGKHFWPSFSYILGIRIDYLSPTVYVTDIFIFVLLILFIFNNYSDITAKSKIKNQRSKTDSGRTPSSHARMTSFWVGSGFRRRRLQNLILRSWKPFLIVVFLLVSILLSKSPLSGFYGFLKLLEFVFFGFYLSQKIKNKEDLINIAFIFSLSVLFQSFLAIAQVINIGSLDGIFYLFGERAFNAQTPGIANASINGDLILRPYATFPHPNVLAAFLLIAMTFIIFNLKFKIFNFKRIIFVTSLGVGTVALLLTLSRIAIALWAIVLIFIVLKQLRFLLKKNKTDVLPSIWKGFYYLFFVILLFGVFASIILTNIRFRFTDISLKNESLVVRQDLIKSAITMIKGSPIFGTGLNNFLQNLPKDQNLKNQNIFTYLQPVHNIYLLIATELGLVGFTFFAWFYFKTVRKIKNQTIVLSSKRRKSKIKNMVYALFFIITILGLFDHYFLTLQQGQLLFSFVLGLCWSKIKIDSKSRIRDNKFNK